MKISADHHQNQPLGDFTTTLRVLPISALAMVIGVVCAFVALALLRLIGEIGGCWDVTPRRPLRGLGRWSRRWCRVGHSGNELQCDDAPADQGRLSGVALNIAAAASRSRCVKAKASGNLSRCSFALEMEEKAKTSPYIEVDIEAGRQLFAAGEYDRAYELLGSASEALQGWGQLLADALWRAAPISVLGSLQDHLLSGFRGHGSRLQGARSPAASQCRRQVPTQRAG